MPLWGGAVVQDRAGLAGAEDRLLIDGSADRAEPAERRGGAGVEVVAVPAQELARGGGEPEGGGVAAGGAGEVVVDADGDLVPALASEAADLAAQAHGVGGAGA